MKVAVIGGGINGMCIAWLCAKSNMEVHLFEKEKIMSQTSQASSKLLHGGLRYLEFFKFSLVKESLEERRFWLDTGSGYTNFVEIVIPIYKGGKRKRWQYKIALILYDLLAGKKNLGKHKYLTQNDLLNLFPSIKTNDLTGGYLYFDGQMDDYALGIWVSRQFTSLGGTLRENLEIDSITTEGSLTLKSQESLEFDCIVNACGPWTAELLTKSNIYSDINLKLVKGTHIVIERSIDRALYLEDNLSGRMIFVLPYQGNTLVGTTEVEHSLLDKIEPTENEVQYLLNVFNEYFEDNINTNQVIGSFAGVRPLIFDSSTSLSKVSREYKIEVNNKLINIFGGKWTTSRKLAENVLSEIKSL